MNETEKLASAVDTILAAGPLGGVLVVFGAGFFWMMRVVFKDLSLLIREQTKALKGLQAEMRTASGEIRGEVQKLGEEVDKNARANAEKLTTLMERTKHVART